MLTEKQLHILRRLYNDSKSLKVHTTQKKQDELAFDLGISRQALSTHLKTLKDSGHIRTGRGFMDITDRALKEIGKMGDEAFVMIKINPSHRETVFLGLKKSLAERIYRTAGEYDIVAVVDMENLNDFLKEAASQEGLEETSSHVVIEMHQV